MTTAHISSAETNMSVALRAAHMLHRLHVATVTDVATVAERVAAMPEKDMAELHAQLHKNPLVRWHRHFKAAFYAVLWTLMSLAMYSLIHQGPPAAQGVDLGLLLAGTSMTAALVFTGFTFLAGVHRWFSPLQQRVMLYSSLVPASKNKALCLQAWEQVKACPYVAQYRESVLTTGRELFLLDMSLMLAWSTKLEESVHQQAQELACKRMHGIA